MDYSKVDKFWNDNYLGHPLFEYKMRKICWNCPSYGWFDPMIEMKTEKPLSACKNCKLAMYCSKECQKEHWKKVHKKHCKYLSGKEPSPILSHGSGEECHKCQSFLDDDDDLGFSPCHIQQSFPGLLRERMLPDVRQCVQLGELTGHFVSKLDKNISILQQIFAKIRLLCEDVDEYVDPYVLVPLAKSLTSLRLTVWYQSLLSATEEDLDKDVESNLYWMREQIVFPLMSNIARCQRFVVTMMGSVCMKLWEYFIFFLNLFFQANSFYRNLFDLQYISSESFELSEETRELKEQVFGSKFLTIWDKLLDAANDRDEIIPLEELLKIYCDGELKRPCDICSAEIQVSAFYPYFLLASDLFGPDEERGSLDDRLKEIVKLFDEEKEDLHFVAFGPKQHFYCAKLRCCERTLWTLIRSNWLISSTGQELSQRFVLNRCDSCYKVTEGAHRCSNCKMKLYCSELCQDNDWKVHKICCEDLKKSEDKRKKKEHGRRKSGKKRMIKQEDFCKEDGVSFHMIDALSKLMSEKGFAVGEEELEKVLQNNSSRYMPKKEQEMMMMMAKITERYLSQNKEEEDQESS